MGIDSILLYNIRFNYCLHAMLYTLYLWKVLVVTIDVGLINMNIENIKVLCVIKKLVLNVF